MIPKKRRLQELTENLSLPPAAPIQSDGWQPEDAQPYAAGVETRFPPAQPDTRTTPVPPRTGPGQMLALRNHMLANAGEVDTLRRQLKEFEGSVPARQLDPARIRNSAWANRDEASFATSEFAGLKSEIERAGGNVQPILVRSLAGEPGHYEVVFGHRRLRACSELKLPVLASIWQGDLSDAELFTLMDRENRERADLSAYEQGRMYARALDEALYPSVRQLADALGVSHTWVNKALSVAQLPQPVVAAFRSPLEVTFRHARQLAQALEQDKRGVLKRAERLRGRQLGAQTVVDQLTGAALTLGGTVPLKDGEQVLGSCTTARDGSMTLRITAAALQTGDADRIATAVRGLLAPAMGPR